MRYEPLELAFELKASLVAGLVAVTRVPGSTAPDASRTSPVKTVVPACARARTAHSSTANIIIIRQRRKLVAATVSFPTVKNWIYKGKLKTIKTAGGHHRIPEGALKRFLPVESAQDAELRRNFRRISGRNQLVGRVTEVKISGFLARVKLSIAGQQITSIITAEAARDLRLRRGELAAALVKSTEVMIIRP
jgi:molybdopterin-binding protein